MSPRKPAAKTAGASGSARPGVEKPGTKPLVRPQGKATVPARRGSCFGTGYLEHLMCSKGTKEHEAILATDAVPNEIHAGLLLTECRSG